MDWVGYWRFLGSVELWLWVVFSVFILLLHKAKDRYFNKLISDASIKVNELRHVYRKSLDEQKDYLRAKADSGKDFINVVVSLFLFLLFFRFVFIPRMSSLIMSFCVVLVLSLSLSRGAAMMFPKRMWGYHTINTFINFVFGGVLLSYMRFIYVPYSLILILITIIIMLLFEAGWSYGSNYKNRA